MGKQTYWQGLLGAALLFLLAAGSVEAAIDPATAQKLLAADGTVHDWFGFTVSVSGNTAIIGSLYDDGGEGAAYVFTRAADGKWSQQAKLTPADRFSHRHFGSSVSMDDDTVVLGTNYDNSAEYEPGSAYVFTRATDGMWHQQAKLTASDGQLWDGFGIAVSVSDDIAVIGVNSLGIGSGSAYVFVRSGATWTQQAKLTASDGAAGDLFGQRVSVNGNTILIGAPHDDDMGTDSGSAYIFTRSGTTWTQQAKLAASDGSADDNFGGSVSVSDDTALIGTARDDDKGTDSGSAYIFTRSGTTWTQQAKLTTTDGVANDLFGYSVSLSGDTALIGAYTSSKSSAYVFVRSGSAWTQQTKLIAPDGVPGWTGESVALDDGTAVIGVTGDDSKGADAGAAYIFSSSSLPAVIIVDEVQCTLADAITAANTDTAAGGCTAGSGEDTIVLQQDVLLRAALPQITSPITIKGQGHLIDGNNDSNAGSVLRIASNGELALNEATITGGNTAADGGGICNWGGNVMLINSTISGNTAGGYGGGIENWNGKVTLTNVTISGNTAGYGGGGLDNLNGRVVLLNATVSNNGADYGGGIYNDDKLTLASSVISGNAATVEGNEVYSDAYVTADHFNVFGHSSESSMQAFNKFMPGSRDVSAVSDGTKPTALSAILSTLADNGGLTLTHALVENSPAVDLDRKCSTGVTEDQRRQHRPLGIGCDAGSFESSYTVKSPVLPWLKLLLKNK